MFINCDLFKTVYIRVSIFTNCLGAGNQLHRCPWSHYRRTINSVMTMTTTMMTMMMAL